MCTLSCGILLTIATLVMMSEIITSSALLNMKLQTNCVMCQYLSERCVLLEVAVRALRWIDNACVRRSRLNMHLSLSPEYLSVLSVIHRRILNSCRKLFRCQANARSSSATDISKHSCAKNTKFLEFRLSFWHSEASLSLCSFMFEPAR